jgi:hypothetical protein
VYFHGWYIRCRFQGAKDVLDMITISEEEVRMLRKRHATTGVVYAKGVDGAYAFQVTTHSNAVEDFGWDEREYDGDPACLQFVKRSIRTNDRLYREIWRRWPKSRPARGKKPPSGRTPGSAPKRRAAVSR